MDDHELSRREVLAGIAAVGTSGAIGAGTGATLQDDVTIPGGTFGAGAVDLQIEDDGGGNSTNGVIDVPLSEDARSGSRTLRIVNDHNPVYPWVRIVCLGDGSPAESLSITLSIVDCESGEELSVIDSGDSFDAFADSLTGGVPLDGDPGSEGRACLGEADELCLELSWSLAESFAGEITAGFHPRVHRATVPAQRRANEPVRLASYGLWRGGNDRQRHQLVIVLWGRWGTARTGVP